MDLHATLLADIFNLFNQQTILDFDNWTEITAGAGPNPGFPAIAETTMQNDEIVRLATAGNPQEAHTWAQALQGEGIR